MEFPRFTVIIPQKNRAEYLVHTLKTCMIQDYPNFEVIVSDDCSDDDSVAVVESLARQDPRIKLFAHKKHLGMRDNFEFALNQVQPGYVMALGGDDGLIPGSISRMWELIQSTGKDLLSWRGAYFHYPNNEGEKSKFILKRNRDYSVKIIKSEDFLNKISKSFFYLIDECPMIYMTGVASTELVNRVKSRTKDHSFYYCPTPDGYSGVVLAGEVDDFAYTNEPLSIVGTTTKSQGKNYMRTDEKSKKEAQEFFNDNIRRTMHEELASQPYSPLVTLMTADYLLTARDLPGWPGKFEPIDFEKLIRATFRLMQHTQFENDLLVRELRIVREIAVQHGMEDLFDELYKLTKRKVVRTDAFSGLVVTRQSIMLDGATVGIANIFDACLAVPFASKLYKLLTVKEVFKVFGRMWTTLKNSFKFSTQKLPEI